MWKASMHACNACLLFIISNKVCIVTIITSHESGVTILINLFDTTSIPKSVHKIMVDTYRIMINVYVKIS